MARMALATSQDWDRGSRAKRHRRKSTFVTGGQPDMGREKSSLGRRNDGRSIEQVWKFASLGFGAVQNGAAVSPSQRWRQTLIDMSASMPARRSPWRSKGGMRPTLHQLSGPAGRSINLHKTDIKSLSSRDAARRAEVVRVVSSTSSIKCPTRWTRASPITR
jgi:hypothetical protein